MRASVDLALFMPFLQAGHQILTPGKRLAREIGQSWTAHCAQSASVIQTPPIEPVDGWLERRWRKAVEDGVLPLQRWLTSHQEAALWQNIVRADLAGNSEFSLTHPGAAARRAQSAWHRLAMQDGAALDDLWSYFQFDEDSQRFAKWVDQYRRRCQDLKMVDRCEAYRQLCQLPADSLVKKQAVALFSLPDLPPLTRRALNHLAEVELILPPHDDGAIGVQGFVARDDELAAIAEWAFVRSRETEDRIGIVLLDMATDRQRIEYFLRQEFDCLDARYNDLPVNFSTGMSLLSTPMYRDAIAALEWEGKPASRSEWLSILRSPYLDLGLEQKARLQMIEALFNTGYRELSVSQVMHVTAREAPESDFLGKLRILRSDRKIKGVKNLLDWCEVIRERLGLWDWPARAPLDSIEYQQYQRFEMSLEALAELSAVLPHQSYESALAFWRGSLDKTTFQPKTPHDSIQVLGPLEALGGRFDALWVCGAQQSVLPRRAHVDPFLPVTLQKKLAFQDLDHQALADEARSLLAVWNAQSPNTVVSFHQTDQGLPSLPSPLLPADFAAAEPQWFPPKSWQLSAALEPFPAEDRVPCSSSSWQGGASLIKDQAACPFRSFVKHRLKASSLPEPTIGVSAAERGGLIHEALFIAWRDIGSSDALQALNESDIAEVAESAVQAAMQRFDNRCEARGYSLKERVGAACWQLEAQVCRRLVSEWLQLEQQRELSFQVLEMESDHTLDLEGLSLTLRPDRIDRLADGRRVVIDYKTRAPARSKWLGTQPEEPQLPLYALLDQAIEGIAFGALTLSEPATFVAMGSELGLGARNEKPMEQQTSGLATDWREMVRHWHSALHQLAGDFLSGNAAVIPTATACQYCDLEAVCRINQRRDLLASTDEVSGS